MAPAMEAAWSALSTPCLQVSDFISEYAQSKSSSSMRFFPYLSGEVSGTTLGHLQDDGGLGIASGLKRSNDGGGGGDVLD